jgi:hypothetical protein
MTDIMQDGLNPMQRRFFRIAVREVDMLRKWSDGDGKITPHRIGEMQEHLAKVLERVYYGFDEFLEGTIEKDMSDE